MIRKELPHITIKTNKELREYLARDLELVNIPNIEHAQLTINAYREALDKRNSFRRRLASFLTGQSKLSRGIGSVIDFVTIFVPYGRQVKNARELVQLLLTRKQMKVLKDKAWYQSKTVWSAIIIVLTGLLQTFGVDLLSNPVLTATVYEVIYVLAGGFGLYGLRDAIGEKINKEANINN